MRKRPIRAAFTLMEVLLVLVILVILAGAVAVPLFTTQQKAYDRAAKADIMNVEKAVKLYQLDLNRYPTTAEGLQALVAPPSSLANPAKWQGPYIEKGRLPTDPWDQPLQYRYPGTHNGTQLPDIWSVGIDGADGTEDDIGNWQ